MNRIEILKNIDRFGWWPAGLVAKFGSKLTQVLPHQHEKIPTLVLRPGGMGDLICADMALGSRAREVFWLLERRSEPWAKHRELRYLCYDALSPQELFALHGVTQKVINLEQYFGLSQAAALWICAVSGGELWGFKTNRAIHFAQNRVEYDPYETHEVVAFSKMFGQALGTPEITLNESPVRERMLPATECPVVAIAGLQRESGALSLDQWVRHIEAWQKQKAIQDFDVIASPLDHAFRAELLKRIHGKAFDGNFGEVCQRVARASEVLTCDGGMVHVASFYGVPTTAIFTSGRFNKWAPLAKGSQILRRKDLPCQPCTLFGQTAPCPRAYACKEIDFK